MWFLCIIIVNYEFCQLTLEDETDKNMIGRDTQPKMWNYMLFSNLKFKSSILVIY